MANDIIIGRRYVLRKRLRQGGFGEVWIAYDLGTNAPSTLPPGDHPIFKKKVAIKILINPQGLALDYFKAEALTMARLPEDTICQVFDHFEEDGRFYIVMEFIDGIDTQELIEARLRPSIRSVCYVGIQILQGLDFMYRAGPIIHRDLTPHNVLCSLGGQVKIVDFGIALTRMGLRPQTAIPGQMFGKAHWAAPEMYLGLEIDHRLDQWNAGVILYELLSGRQAFAGTQLEAMNAIVCGSPPPIHSINPSVPASLSNVIMRMMARDRDDRYRTPSEAMEALLAGAPSDWLFGRKDLQALVAVLRPADRGSTNFPAFDPKMLALGSLPATAPPPTSVTPAPLPPPPMAPLQAVPAEAITHQPVPRATPKLEDYPTPAPRHRTAVQMPPSPVAVRPVASPGPSAVVKVDYGQLRGGEVPQAIIDDQYARLPTSGRRQRTMKLGLFVLFALVAVALAFVELRQHLLMP